MPFAARPTGTPLAVLATMLPHSLVLRRAGTNLTAQDCMVDFSGAGRDALVGAGATAGGYNGEIDGCAVYCVPGADIAVGDVFRHGAGTYTVAWVSPPGWAPVDGATLVVAWARATKARGVTP
jgi:hypothetical protein